MGTMALAVKLSYVSAAFWAGPFACDEVGSVVLFWNELPDSAQTGTPKPEQLAG